MNKESIKLIFTNESLIVSLIKEIIITDKQTFAKKVALDFYGREYNVENYIYSKLSELIRSNPERAVAVAELCCKKAVKSIIALECLISCFIVSPNEVRQYLHMTLTEFQYKLKNNDTDYVTEYQFLVFGFLYAFGIGNMNDCGMAIKCFDKAENRLEAKMFCLLVKAKLLESRFSKTERDDFFFQLMRLNKIIKKLKPIELREYMEKLHDDIKYFYLCGWKILWIVNVKVQ